MLSELKQQLRAHASPARARVSASFFKTGEGEYGAGDVFLGVTVPDTRRVVKQFHQLPLVDIQELINSPLHEERLCGFLILVHQFERGDAKVRARIFRFYCANSKRVNNWDLVDLTAPNIVGEYLFETKDSGALLVRYARSQNLWQRRIAILATFAFIRKGRWVPTLNIARILLNDPEDLIAKAVGWMLREVGKRIDQDIEEEFLKKHYHRMPRTMLRYAIERFSKRRARMYLDGKI